ncbi:MAG: N-acetylglucosaminidase [Eubacteriales bacterium]
MSVFKKVLKITILVLLFMFFLSGAAEASNIEGVIVDDSKGYSYMIDYTELIESYTRKVVGTEAILYDDFTKKKVVAIATSNSVYVDYEDCITAYTKAVVSGKTFDLIKYAESSSAKPYLLSHDMQKVSVVKGKLVYTDWEPGEEAMITYTQYSCTLEQAVNTQMNRSPQTDLYGGGWQSADATLVKWFLNPVNFQEGMLPAVTIKNGPLNMREGPGTSYAQITTLSTGSGPFQIISEAKDVENKTWYRILTSTRAGWVHSDYVTKTEKPSEGNFQFLVLSGTATSSSKEINNNILKGKGILEGKADAFIQGSQQYNINEIFLISLALHESGNGTSQLANGVEYNGKTVYNMYGIGAYDSNPIETGGKYAYEQGWFTPEKGIIGGAKFAGQNYINHSTYKQDTLYKMRWNPASPGSHQYATDIGWASKQVKQIKALYDQLDTYTLVFNIPKYK